jgi:hypothetical protein
VKALALAILIVGACAGALPNIVWPELVTCLPQVGKLVEEVREILLADGPEHALSPENVRKLEALALEYGADLISCVIEQVIGTWIAPDKPTGTAAQLLAAERGQDFLNERGVHAATFGD